MDYKNPITFATITLIILSACGEAQMPVVRPAPTMDAATFQLTAVPMDESVIAIATAPPTPTPYLTDSGLLMYDDFNTDGDLDPERWVVSHTQYSILDGVLVFQNDSPIFPRFIFGASPTTAWEISAEGQIKFSLETRVRIPSTNFYFQESLQAGLTMNFAEEYWFQFGYFPIGTRIDVFCNVNFPTTEMSQIGWSGGYYEWHKFRVDISEIPERSFLSVNLFIDNNEVCSFIPSGELQGHLRQEDAISLVFYHYWEGEWDQSIPFIMEYDYIAVSPP